jgi:hypothetical protein
MVLSDYEIEGRLRPAVELLTGMTPAERERWARWLVDTIAEGRGLAPQDASGFAGAFLEALYRHLANRVAERGTMSTRPALAADPAERGYMIAGAAGQTWHYPDDAGNPLCGMTLVNAQRRTVPFDAGPNEMLCERCQAERARRLEAGG